jgi:membrane protein implicated in regulation of membrane protease activity
MPVPDIGLLNCFYLFLLMLGVFYALFLMLAGGLHAIHLPSLDLNIGGHGLPPAHLDIGGAAGHDVSLSNLSPISIAAFVTSFGGLGLIASLGFGLDSLASAGAAVIGSLLIAIASHFAFFYFFIAPQASSALRGSDIVGRIAQVTAPIPGNSVGEIAYVSMGERHMATARSSTGESIPRGAMVVIEDIAGTVVNVRLQTKSTEKEGPL